MRMVCQVRGARQVPFPITHIPNRISGQWSRQLWRWGRFERPGGCSVIHQGQQVLSLLLCWWPSTFRRSFSSPAKCSQCQNWRQHQCAVWDFFSPRKLFRTFDPTIRTLVQLKFALIFCKWRRSFWSKCILNHKWTACLILVSVSLLGADSLYTSAAECIYNWRGCYQIS